MYEKNTEEVHNLQTNQKLLGPLLRWKESQINVVPRTELGKSGDHDLRVKRVKIIHSEMKSSIVGRARKTDSRFFYTLKETGLTSIFPKSRLFVLGQLIKHHSEILTLNNMKTRHSHTMKLRRTCRRWSEYQSIETQSINVTKIKLRFASL